MGVEGQGRKATREFLPTDKLLDTEEPHKTASGERSAMYSLLRRRRAGGGEWAGRWLNIFLGFYFFQIFLFSFIYIYIQFQKLRKEFFFLSCLDFFFF